MIQQLYSWAFIYTREMNTHVHTKTHALMFIAAYFAEAKP